MDSSLLKYQRVWTKSSIYDRKRMRRIIITMATLISFGCLHISAQIVNIENFRVHTDTTGWAGYIKLGISASKEVNEVLNILSDAQLQYKNKNDLYLLRGNTNFSKSGGTTFSENTFIHFRYNRKFNNWVRWEAFTQWQHNKITGIKNRFLVGSGPRIKILQSKIFYLYAGLALMYENEDEIQPDQTIKNYSLARSSNYLSFSLQITPTFKITHTSYYQPLLDNFIDYRLFSQSSLNFDITKKFGFECAYRYLHDNYPAPGIPTNTYFIENLIRFKF